MNNPAESSADEKWRERHEMGEDDWDALKKLPAEISGFAKKYLSERGIFVGSAHEAELISLVADFVGDQIWERN